MIKLLTLKRYHGEIDWNVGTLFSHAGAFIQLLINCKNLGMSPKIKYTFGSFATKWNSGRHIIGGDPSFELCRQAIDLYNSYGISARFTFSNHLITKEDLSEKLCNETLEYMDALNRGN